MLDRNKLSIIALAAIFFGVITYYFGLFIDLTGDAGKYAAIARHIAETGDYIDLKIHGNPYEQKPPLLFWLSALGFKIGGFNNFSYKIFPVLYGLLGLFFTFKSGELLYDRRIGLTAAWMLAFCQYYFLYTMDLHTDLLLQANVTFAFWQLARYLKKGKTLSFVLAFVATGLAMLSKGPAGAAVPAFALIIHLTATKNLKQLWHPKWIVGIIIALAVSMPALIGLARQFGIEGIKFFFWTNNAGRISGVYAGSNTDYFFYVHTLLYLFAPWALLLGASIFLEFRSLIRNPLGQKEYLVFGGTWVFFIIISLARGKAPNYIFIIVPLLTLLTAKWTIVSLEHVKGRQLKALRAMHYGYTLAMWVFFIFMAVWLFPSGNPLYTLLGAAIAALSVYILMQKKYPVEQLLLPSILIVTLINFYMNTHMLPYMFRFQAPPQAARIFNERAGAGDRLYNFRYGQYELFFYGKTGATQIKSDKQLYQALQKEGSWIFTDREGYEKINQVSPAIDTVFHFHHKGMNRIGRSFILPHTRSESLVPMFLIKTGSMERYSVPDIDNQ